MDLHELEYHHQAALQNLSLAQTEEERRTYRDLAGYFARRARLARREMERAAKAERLGISPAAC